MLDLVSEFAKESDRLLLCESTELQLLDGNRDATAEKRSPLIDTRSQKLAIAGTMGTERITPCDLSSSSDLRGDNGGGETGRTAAKSQGRSHQLDRVQRHLGSARS